MPDLKPEEIERYLQSVLGTQVRLLSMAVLGDDHRSKDIKGFGYGTPVRVGVRVDEARAPHRSPPHYKFCSIWPLASTRCSSVRIASTSRGALPEIPAQ